MQVTSCSEYRERVITWKPAAHANSNYYASRVYRDRAIVELVTGRAKSFLRPVVRCVWPVSRDSTIGWVASTREYAGSRYRVCLYGGPAATHKQQSTDTQYCGIGESHSIRSRMEIKCSVDRYADWFVFCDLLAWRGSVLNCGIYVLS